MKWVAGVTMFLLTGLGGCGTATTDAEAVSAVVGACARDPVILGGPKLVCLTDLECPCGSFCDTAALVCTYACMPVGQPPLTSTPGGLAGNPAPCAAANACDDTGRCVGVAGPPGTAVVLGADPLTMTTVAGGASKPLQVRLRLTDPSPSELAASQATIVRVIARAGAEVSCNGTTYATECQLTGWTFAFNGTALEATRPARVRTVAKTKDGSGDVLLAIDTTGARLSIPAPATTPLVSEDGLYAGVATSPSYPAGVRVTARVRAHQLLVREPSRTIAPDGALLLDLRTSGASGARRRTVWLREPGAADGAGAIVGDYGAGIATIDLEARTLAVPLSFNVPGASGLTDWKLQLTRTADHALECATDAACGTGRVCATTLQACVPSAVWTPTTAAIGNQLDDPRSAAWWTSLGSMLTTKPAFATTSADMVESVLCSVDEASAGRFGVSQLKRPGASVSRSGELACVGSTGAPNGSPGAVGFATLADRVPDAAIVTPAVLQTCMQDLARQPPPASASFAQHFAASVGQCANLSRFVAALRLLTTDALDRSTLVDLEPRGRGLLVRLIQQWATLHGLVASTGVSQRDYNNVLEPTSPAATRAALVGVLDTVDRGWSALLDRRVAPAIRNAVRWTPLADNDHSRDYRLLKKPVVYWTFNGATPTVDLIRGVALAPQGTATGVCQLGSTGISSFLQGFDCPGYAAILPTDAPRLIDDASLGGAGNVDNLSVTINVDALDRDFDPELVGAPVSSAAGGVPCPIGKDCDPPPDPEPEPEPPPPPPYGGGTLIATPTLAIAESVAASGATALVLAHPTASGVELTTFTGYGRLGVFSTGNGRHGTTITVVRDAKRRMYTLYVWRASGLLQLTKAYVKDPVGTLDWVPFRTIRVGASGALPAGHYWAPYRRSYPGYLDDVAVFDSALSAPELSRFAAARGGVESRRDVWPENMVLTSQGTHEITVPLGAQLLETQVAELEVAARLLDAVQDRAQVACESNQVTAAAARADVDAVVARVGRTLRQSHLIEGFAELDTGDRALAAGQLLRAKRIELARALEPARCTTPFEMADDEVPIYHNSISPDASETNAYFAASDHLLALAEARAHAARDALTEVRQAYDQARQSQIQQLQSDQARALRIEAITAQYGDGLRRLCGLADQSNTEIVQAIVDEDPENPFSIDTCYIVPTTACLAQPDRSLVDADPTCYRGQLGEILVGLRSAYFAHQTAQQSWLTAIDNAEAAKRFCIWKEMDYFTCTSTDRGKLSGVQCSNHPGTLDLIAEFNDYLDEEQSSKALWTTLGNGVAGVMSAFGSRLPTGSPAPTVAPVVAGGIVVGAAALKGVTDWWGANKEAAIDKRRRQHQEVLARRAAEADIMACWNQADQYERAIAAAELGSEQALSQIAAAASGLTSALGEAEQIVLELPVVINRERTRLSIPYAFHYWLDEKIATYDRMLETARRYTYVALRATEYDMQASYRTPVMGKPLRSAVIGATHPQQLVDQLLLMRDQTNPRLINNRPPSLGHLTFDVGDWQWGIPIGSPVVGTSLAAYLRPVYSTAGEYLGKGLHFSFVPENNDAPIARCAERIWRVAVGAVGFPANNPNFMHTKLIKRNLFASRVCGADGFRPAIWRPESNLLVSGGDAATFQPPTTASFADTALVRLDLEGALDAFRNRDQAYNGSSTELSLQGLYGDYVLLFPAAALAHNLVPVDLLDLNIRFDFLSVDDTPPVPLGSTARTPAAQPQIRLDRDIAPIIVE